MVNTIKVGNTFIFNLKNFPQLIKTLNPKNILAFHNSKYALANHAWYEPLENMYENTLKYNFNLHTPKIGK